MIVSSNAETKRADYRFERLRQDRLYVPLEPSAPPLKGWVSSIAVAFGIIILGTLAFPAADLIVDLMAKW